MAMAHRGRLNVLYNTMGKMARQIFRELEDQTQHLAFDDVKYHLGYSSNRKLASGKNIHLSLCFNPSHLEFVNPIAMGRVRAKMGRHPGSQARARLLHPDPRGRRLHR